MQDFVSVSHATSDLRLHFVTWPSLVLGSKHVTISMEPTRHSCRRHERALEQLKADIAAKEAEETAPRSFKARPILKCVYTRLKKLANGSAWF